MKAMLTVLFFFGAICIYSTIWEVNNDPNFGADFTTMQQAHDAATVNAGDTLYVYGSPVSYGDLTMTKRLFIIGTGYYLLQNPQTQANRITSIMGSLFFNAGSQYSVITGMTIQRIVVSTDNITIKRNNIYNGDWTYNGILIETAYNLLLIQNAITPNINSYYGNASIRIISNFTHDSGLMISNNIIYNNTGEYAINGGTSSSNISNLWGAIISNNVVYGQVFVANCEYFNNIHEYQSFTPTNVYFHHNIGNSTQYAPEGSNGNRTNINMAWVFVNSGSPDAKFTLIPNSTAQGAGMGGSDCGIFGGAFPYVLSGMPSEIPSVHTFMTSGAGYSIPVQVGAKSHN